MDYDGYCEGIGATSCNDQALAGDLLAAGYAVLGVSVRGTGCSTGNFDFRSPEESSDGAAVVRWAAMQTWSTGRVALFGDSFPGLTQPGIAALRPVGLAAIAPFQIVDDVYRDVGDPGGITNTEFGAFWGLGDQPVADAENPVYGLSQSDPQCAANYAGHQPANANANIFVSGNQHPWFDSYWQSKQVGDAATRINVPVLGCVTWQDDEVGSRPAWTLFRRIAPSQLWLIGSNGNHGLCDQNNELVNQQVVKFFDRYVRGRDNGFERTPHVQIWHETTAATKTDVGVLHASITSTAAPSWVSTYGAWPPPTSTTALFLQSGGGLDSYRPKTGSRGETYRAPSASAGTEDGVVVGQHNALWEQAVPPGGALAWTTARLQHDVEIFGPASVDLWLASTGTDTDVQATVTEVRPDGQEMYVARGWLRASHRRLDPRLSTSTRPYQTHLARDAAPLTPGKPTLLRVEVFPFDHVFRAGSRIRLIVDTPSQTGGWNFQVLPTPVTNTVLHDPGHRSRIVFGVIPGARAQRPLPACNAVLNQPCRADAYPAANASP